MHTITPKDRARCPGLAPVGMAALLAAVAGCSWVGDSDEFADPVDCGHLVIRIGHQGAPGQEEVEWQDGMKEPLWAKSPSESAARALHLFVKCADQGPLDAEDFREIRRIPGSPERVIVERDRRRDVHDRMFRVRLYEDQGRWIPEAIFICQGRDEEDDLGSRRRKI